MHIMSMVWQETKERKFTLIVDDFGRKYFNKKDSEYLLSALTATKENTQWKLIGLKISILEKN